MILGVMACPHGKGGAPAPPPPDPSIGEAQKAAAALSQQQYDDYKKIYQPQQQAAADKANEIAQQQETSSAALQASQKATADNLNQTYQDTYVPLMKTMVGQATNYDSEGNFQQQANLAVGDVNNTYGAQQQSQSRQMQSVGVDPTSGAYQSMWNANGINQAGAQAAAATRARTGAQQLGWNMEQQAAAMGQNLPSAAVANSSGAQNSSNSAVTQANGQVANQIQIGGASTQAGTAATNTQNQIGQLGAGSYQTQVNAWNDQAQQAAASSAGTGQMIGGVVMAGAMAF